MATNDTSTETGTPAARIKPHQLALALGLGIAAQRPA